jgi:hypothetical protein
MDSTSIHRGWVILGLAFVAGCGGGGGGGGTPILQNAAVGGAWFGTLATGEDVVGIAAETGEFHLVNAVTGEQYFGTVTANGTAISGQFTGYTAPGFTFADGTTRGTGSLTGAVVARTSMTAATSFTTSAGTPDNNTVTLAYDATYERDSSLAVLAGTFVDFATDAVADIDVNGALFMQDPTSNCVINGTFSIIDPQFNAYRLQYTYSSCAGADAALNGVTFRGLAVLDITTGTDNLLVFTQGLAGSTGIAALRLLERI